MSNRTVGLEEIEEALTEVPILDIHTHLVGDRLSAGGLQDILLYHMVISELYAAGCPDGNRLTQYPGYPTQSEAGERLRRAVPFLPHVRGTAIQWILRRILADLYSWHEPITPDNWRRLDAVIQERSADTVWPLDVLDKAGIRRSVTELTRRGTGMRDDTLQYSVEWGFFTRCQWGEFDTALYELERCWGAQPESPLPVGIRKPPAN